MLFFFCFFFFFRPGGIRPPGSQNQNPEFGGQPRWVIFSKTNGGGRHFVKAGKGQVSGIKTFVETQGSPPWSPGGQKCSPFPLGDPFSYIKEAPESPLTKASNLSACGRGP
eukprot:FR740213.1.p1 GENE.FR740213.1~~FR740213.1.p1  ORF type:complete len:111 (-),score=32.53 FR740213.1:303-635(-)